MSPTSRSRGNFFLEVRRGGVVLEVDVGFVHYKFLSCLSEGGESPGYAVCGSLVRGG